MSICKNKRVLSGSGVHALRKDRANIPSPATRLFLQIPLLGILFLLNTGFTFLPAHFSSNSFSIPENEKPSLEQNVAWLKENPQEVVILEGHCDEWGADLYNLELGDRRAREVKAYLIERGIDPERIIMLVSFGKRKPRDPRHIHEAWQQNRRVEFVLR